MTVALAPPEQGQMVSVRSRQWVVNDVRPSTLLAPALKPTFSGPQHLLTLASVEDDGLCAELQVFWEIEHGTGVVESPCRNRPASTNRTSWTPSSTPCAGAPPPPPTRRTSRFHLTTSSSPTETPSVRPGRKGEP